MARVRIHDDGDETVWIDVDGEMIADLNHDDDGWAGMTRGIELIKKLGEKLGFEIEDEQGIV